MAIIIPFLLPDIILVTNAVIALQAQQYLEIRRLN